MIQRVQTLFLLGVTILMLVLLFVPIWQKEAKPANTAVKKKVILTAMNVSLVQSQATADAATMAYKSQESTWYIATLAIITAIIALVSVFRYKNRLLQLKLGVLNTALISGLIGTIFLGISQGDRLMTDSLEQEFLIGFFLPPIAIFLNFMANRFIRKDENLVRSVDRIR